MFKKSLFLSFAIVMAVFALTLNSSVAVQKSKTLDNLQKAFNGESNAHAKYLAYAKKADAEGYTQVASLFRAAAKAEEIHKNRHAEVIKKLGAVPKADIKTPTPKSTKENLEDALKGETYEKDKMYPEFIAQAKTDNIKEAVKTFNGAKSAEVEHAKLYASALKDLSKWKGGTKLFYVCPVCGFTALQPSFAKCPVCYTEKGKFLKIS